jgi:hypothetical protein
MIPTTKAAAAAAPVGTAPLALSEVLLDVALVLVAAELAGGFVLLGCGIVSVEVLGRGTFRSL